LIRDNTSDLLTIKPESHDDFVSIRLLYYSLSLKFTKFTLTFPPPKSLIPFVVPTLLMKGLFWCPTCVSVRGSVPVIHIFKLIKYIIVIVIPIIHIACTDYSTNNPPAKKKAKNWIGKKNESEMERKKEWRNYRGNGWWGRNGLLFVEAAVMRFTDLFVVFCLITKRHWQTQNYNLFLFC